MYTFFFPLLNRSALNDTFDAYAYVMHFGFKIKNKETNEVDIDFPLHGKTIIIIIKIITKKKNEENKDYFFRNRKMTTREKKILCLITELENDSEKKNEIITNERYNQVNISISNSFRFFPLSLSLNFIQFLFLFIRDLNRWFFRLFLCLKFLVKHTKMQQLGLLST